MSFDGKEGAMISLQEAADLTANYRNRNEGAVKGYFYGKDHLETLLSQNGCVGIRIYFGEDNTGTTQLVLVGANGSEDDLLGQVLENGTPCPPRCGSRNDLNS
ncbi:MAG: hypothetical protein EP305_05510 [Bacteroidetes bacterium]|nr:MAG: hypothetical protein EP305_05510 [Bacteroidota bacterium]